MKTKLECSKDDIKTLKDDNKKHEDDLNSYEDDDPICQDFVEKINKEFIENAVKRITKSREMKELKNLELDRHKGHEDDILSKTSDEGVFDEDSNCSKIQDDSGLGRSLQRNRSFTTTEELEKGRSMVDKLVCNTQTILSRVSSFFPLLRSFSRNSSDSGIQSMPSSRPGSRPLSRRSSLFSLGSFAHLSETEDSDEEFMSHVKVVPGGNITDDYTLLELLGEGAFSKVYLAESKVDKGGLAAVKVINKSELCKDQDKMFLVEKEIEIMSQLDHPNIVKLYEVYVNEEEVCLVMELAKGGEVFDKLLEFGCLSENESAKLMSQVLEAVRYLHMLGIVHRDLKPENLLLYDNIASSKVMVTDFGLSDYEEELSPESAVCGTATYLSPEVIKRTSSTRAQDMWSLGVICYIILCGYPPFFRDNKDDGDERELLKQIARGKYKFHNNFWDNISLEAKDFVRGLMCPNPGRRLTVQEALDHPWIRNNTRNFLSDSYLQSFVQGVLLLGLALSFFYLYFFILSQYFNIENFMFRKLSETAGSWLDWLGQQLSEIADFIGRQLKNSFDTSFAQMLTAMDANAFFQSLMYSE